MRRLQTGFVIALTTVGVIQVFLPRSTKMCLLQVAKAPVLNDVSTDLDDPPSFIVARHDPLPEHWKPRIRAAYPDIHPLTVRTTATTNATSAPDITTTAAEGAVTLLDAVTVVSRAMPRWQVQTVVDGRAAGSEAGPGEMVLEAVASTRLFRFKDDVVVRVRPEKGQPAAAAAGGAGGSAAGGGGALWRVDVRSRSRLGKGDLGANAARIRVFLGKLREELTLRGLRVEK